IATLSASLVAALVFTPTLGSLIGKPSEIHREARKSNGLYMRTVRLAIHHPILTILIAFALLIGVPMVYGTLGKTVEFFPNVEPDTGAVLVHARGNLSLTEQDQLVHQVENRVLAIPGLTNIYARSGSSGQGGGGLGGDVTADVVGQIQFEFAD